METPLDYYQIDSKRDISYPEQRVAVKQVTKHGFIVSMGIVDSTALFDPTKKFSDNITTISAKNHQRARCFEGTHLHRAYYAGMCTSHDKKISRGNHIPILYFNTYVNLKKNAKDMDERIAPLTVHQVDAPLYGVYTFRNFEKPGDDRSGRDAERLNTAMNLIDQLQEIPDFYKYCLKNAHNPIDPCLGDIFSASVTHIIKSAASASAYDMKEKRSKVQLLTQKVVKDENNTIIDKSFVTLEDYVETKNKLGCSRMTAPYRDIGAAYNIWQWKKVAEGKHPEGGREAHRVAAFLNEQDKTYMLNPYVSPEQTALQNRRYAPQPAFKYQRTG